MSDKRKPNKFFKAHLKPKFLEVLSSNKGYVIITCKEIGIDKKTYHYWLKHDQAFKIDVRLVLKQQLEYLKKHIIQYALGEVVGGNFPALKYALETRMFRDREYDKELKLEKLRAAQKIQSNDNDTSVEEIKEMMSRVTKSNAASEQSDT